MAEKKTETENRTEQLVIAFTPNERRRVEEIAEEEGISMSAVIRRSVLYYFADQT